MNTVTIALFVACLCCGRAGAVLDRPDETDDGAYVERDPDSDDVEAMQKFLDYYDREAKVVFNRDANAEWDYLVNMTNFNMNLMENQRARSNTFWKNVVARTKKFEWKKLKNRSMRRQFKFLSSEGVSVLSEKKRVELEESINDMSFIYNTAEVCIGDKNCTTMDPGLINLMANSVNYDELTEAFVKWRDVSGKRMKHNYTVMVDLLNEAARKNGYADEGDQWRAHYEVKDFEGDMEELYQTIRPFYENLQAYTRAKLMTRYKASVFPKGGLIPSHILGNMWGQTWTNLIELLRPYMSEPSLDVTSIMQAKNWNATHMYRQAEKFFMSLGLPGCVKSFWTKSLLVEPKDKTLKVECHPSAYDFYTGDDFRIKMCTKVVLDDLVTLHHEMGHNEYQHLYSDLPMPFRDGANNAFHEAIGDTIALSASTPEYLHKIGLIGKPVIDAEADVNYLMRIALDKIAFLPFGYMMDKFRWGVFDGTTTPENYTRHWWDLRCKYQGISPPVTRGPDDFDPGAKYHIAANVGYIRYFISFIIQFQFHGALCKESGHTGPLHRCDIYKSEKAGAKLKAMLKMGSSKPWPEAMEALTGQRKFKADSLMEYFKPLIDFLVAENKKMGVSVGWTHKCPDNYFKVPDTGKGKPADNSSTSISITVGSVFICFLVSLLF